MKEVTILQQIDVPTDFSKAFDWMDHIIFIDSMSVDRNAAYLTSFTR